MYGSLLPHDATVIRGRFVGEYFPGRETGSEKLNNFPKMTELEDDPSGIRSKFATIHYFSLHQAFSPSCALNETGYMQGLYRVFTDK